MTNTDKLLLFAMESARCDQLDALLAFSQEKGLPLAEIVASEWNPEGYSFSVLEALTTWRYLLIETDVAPITLWRKAVVQWPFKIVAISESGGSGDHNDLRWCDCAWTKRPRMANERESFRTHRSRMDENCTDNDVQSGGGIVQKIRDEVRGFEKHDRRKTSSLEPPSEIVLDPGVPDKRLLIVEEEFSHVLKMARRQGNTLTENYRKSWDSPRTLRTSNKNSRLTASDPHVSLIGHTNRDELLATLTDIELSNGFADRIIWCAATRRLLMHMSRRRASALLLRHRSSEDRLKGPCEPMGCAWALPGGSLS
jgi:hypothetical protein